LDKNILHPSFQESSPESKLGDLRPRQVVRAGDEAGTVGVLDFGHAKQRLPPFSAQGFPFD
jgi:hypothetical protein